MNILNAINIVIGVLSTIFLYSTYDLFASDDGWGGLIAAFTLLFHIAGLILSVLLLLIAGADPITKIFYMVQSITNFIILMTIVILFASPPTLVATVIIWIMVFAELIPLLLVRTIEG